MVQGKQVIGCQASRAPMSHLGSGFVTISQAVPVIGAWIVAVGMSRTEPGSSTALKTEIDVLWITAGLGCDGDTIAMTAATQPSLENQ
jgi:hypothetical protein